MIDLKSIKLIISEVDGIITEGMIPIDELGNVPFKEYYFKDFEAINEIKKNFNFAILSKDNRINYNLFRKKQIAYFWSKNLDKSKVLVNEVIPRYVDKGITLANIAYIGCSFSDIKVMPLVGLSVCTADAPIAVRERSNIILNTVGGCGVLSEFYESVIRPNLVTL